MIFPRGKGFDLVYGVVITVVLDDLAALTGAFLGDIRKRCDYKEFILIQLTSPFFGRCGLKIPEGTICAINLDQIQFVFPGTTCQDKKHDDKYHDKFDDKCHAICDDKKYEDKCHDKDDVKCCHDKWPDKKDDDTCVINICCNGDD